MILFAPFVLVFVLVVFLVIIYLRIIVVILPVTHLNEASRVLVVLFRHSDVLLLDVFVLSTESAESESESLSSIERFRFLLLVLPGVMSQVFVSLSESSALSSPWICECFAFVSIASIF